jgi:branched-chain amino acid transport system ATP-binding protein
MVAIGRALMSNPRVLLCDEISLGLAPVIIKDIYAAVPKIRKAARRDRGRAGYRPGAGRRRPGLLHDGRPRDAGRARPMNAQPRAIHAAYFGAAA